MQSNHNSILDSSLTSSQWRESSDRQRVHYILLLKLALSAESGGTLNLGDAIAETGATREELAANPLLNVRRLLVRVLYYPQEEEERRRRERIRRFKIGRTRRERNANFPRTLTQTVENQANDRDVSETSRRHLRDISETSTIQQSKTPEYACQNSVETLQKLELDSKLVTSINIKEESSTTVSHCTVLNEFKNKDGKGVGDARGRGEGNALSSVWAQGLLFRLRTGEVWKLSEQLLNTFRTFYKESEIRDNCRMAAVWLETNPAKRKTAAGMPNFLGAWMARARKAAK